MAEEGERRKSRRLCRGAEVTVKVISFPLDGAPPLAVEMSDVSEGGVGLFSPEPFSEGISMEVTIRLPGWFKHTHTITRYREENKPLTAVGRVKRCFPLPEGGYELGVEFTDIWDDHWQAMRQYLKELAEEESRSTDLP